MKHLVLTGVFFICSFTSFSQETEGHSEPVDVRQNTLYNIGDLAHGGVVFYVDDTGDHGLVCTLADLSVGAKWGSKRKVKKNERLSEEFNTMTTIFNGKSENNNYERDAYAEKLCRKLKVKYNGEKYRDWRLPTIDELELLYEHRAIINDTAEKNGGGLFMDTYYWSGTEFEYARAWVVFFDTGQKSYHYKNYRYNVRAIHSF